MKLKKELNNKEYAVLHMIASAVFAFLFIVATSFLFDMGKNVIPIQSLQEKNLIEKENPLLRLNKVTEEIGKVND